MDLSGFRLLNEQYPQVLMPASLLKNNMAATTGLGGRVLDSLFSFCCSGGYFSLATLSMVLGLEKSETEKVNPCCVVREVGAWKELYVGAGLCLCVL